MEVWGLEEMRCDVMGVKGGYLGVWDRESERSCWLGGILGRRQIHVDEFWALDLEGGVLYHWIGFLKWFTG